MLIYEQDRCAVILTIIINMTIIISTNTAVSFLLDNTNQYYQHNGQNMGRI